MKRIPNFKIVEGDPNLIRDEILIETDKSTGDIIDIKKRVSGNLQSLLSSTKFVDPNNFKVVSYSNTSVAAYNYYECLSPSPQNMGLQEFPYIINIDSSRWDGGQGIISFVTSDYSMPSSEASGTEPDKKYIQKVVSVDDNMRLSRTSRLSLTKSDVKGHMIAVPIDTDFYKYLSEGILTEGSGGDQFLRKAYEHAIFVAFS